jgi:hypothetical protein
MKKGGKTGFRVLPLGHATPRAVPTWPWFCVVKKGMALSLTVCTATAWAVHRQVLFGTTAAFYPRLVNLCWSEEGHRHGHHRAISGALPHFSREEGKRGG